MCIQIWIRITAADIGTFPRLNSDKPSALTKWYDQMKQNLQYFFQLIRIDLQLVVYTIKIPSSWPCPSPAWPERWPLRSPGSGQLPAVSSQAQGWRSAAHQTWNQRQQSYKNSKFNVRFQKPAVVSSQVQGWRSAVHQTWNQKQQPDKNRKFNVRFQKLQ